MKNLAPIFWHEGLFIRPHHLQQQDHYHVDHLSAHLELINRFHWGVEAMEIEKGALKGQSFELARCSAVFPGGQVVSLPANAQIDPRSFAEHLPAAGDPLEVFLGLPRTKPTEANYIGPEDSRADGRRYRLRTREIHDEVSGEQPASISFALANIRILFGDEERSAFECIKIAEVIQKSAERFEVSDDFVPACLRVDAMPGLLRCGKRIRDGLAAKARSLHEMKRERGSVEPHLQLWLLTVNSYVGLINHLVASGNTHPFQFYGVLVQIAGALSSFSEQAESWDVDPYVHEKPGPTFRGLATKIESYLIGVVPENFWEIKLGWSADSGHYAGTFSDEHFDDSFEYCVTFAGDKPPAEIRDQVEKSARVGSPGRIATLRDLFLRGVALRSLDTAPPEIPKRPAAYFKVDPIGPEWESIREDRAIAIHLPDDDLSVSFFVIRH